MFSGTVRAAPAWGAEDRDFVIEPASSSSLSFLLHRDVEMSSFVLDLDSELEVFFFFLDFDVAMIDLLIRFGVFSKSRFRAERLVSCTRRAKKISVITLNAFTRVPPMP